MKLQSVAANEIRSYVADRPKEENMVVRVELEGQIVVLPVYRIPTKLLRFNIRNGRFASELRQKESELKRKLDNANTEDAKVIRTLLLEQSATETALLKKDLLAHEQIEPGIITYDGAVINANRRMSVISMLFDETHDPKWEYLKVGILPDAVSEKDLWRIEAGLQFGKDFRLEYGPINELLKLREGIECGLDPEDIANTLLGCYSAKDVKERLNRLDLIDRYLDQIEKPGDYAVIGEQRSMEKFNSLSTNVINHLRTKATLDQMDLFRIAQTGFALIRDKKASHWDIRKLAPIAKSTNARSKLFSDLPADPFKADSATLKDAFENAKDVVDAETEHEKPERLLQRALTTIQSIDKNSPKLQLKPAQDALAALIAACKLLEVEQ